MQPDIQLSWQNILWRLLLTLLLLLFLSGSGLTTFRVITNGPGAHALPQETVIGR